MISKLLFALYAGSIPLVPLYGVKHYGKSGEKNKRNFCILLFAFQALISLGAIIDYL